MDMKILIIEPDEYYHHQYQSHLGDLAELVYAKNASGSLDLIKKFTPDCVILELALPHSSGYDVLEDVRNGKNTKNIPIIIFTKVDNLEDVAETMKYGVSAYFQKGRDSMADVRQMVVAYQTVDH